MRDFIERLRTKPEQVRRRIALFSSAGITGVVAIGWFTALISSGSLALAPTPEGERMGVEVQTAFSETQEDFSDLIGAVGAFSGTGSNSPDLEIVDGGASSTLDRTEPTPEQTVIQF
jgi:hypothetical protein